ncbi:MAG: metalloregulator ArsR/SmtB family transcription factor [Clostridiaceae bacterium]
MKQLVNIFKLLSDESRLRVILLLAEDKLCVCEITGILDLPQPTVSKALSKLRDLDLVRDERSDKYIYYSLKNEDLVLQGIIDDILMNLQNYPLLANDKNRISMKEIFKNQIQLIDTIGI